MRYGVSNGDWVKITDNPEDYPIAETLPPNHIDMNCKAVAHYELQSGILVKVWEIQPLSEEERKSIEEQENVE